MSQSIWRHRNSRRVLLEWAWAAVVLVVIAWMEHPFGTHHAAETSSTHATAPASYPVPEQEVQASHGLTDLDAGRHACFLALTHVESMLDACINRSLTAAAHTSPTPMPPTVCTPCDSSDGVPEASTSSTGQSSTVPMQSPMNVPTLEGTWDLVKAMLFGAACTFVCRWMLCGGHHGGNAPTSTTGCAALLCADVVASEAVGRGAIADAHNATVAMLLWSMGRTSVIAQGGRTDGTQPGRCRAGPPQAAHDEASAVWSLANDPALSQERDVLLPAQSCDVVTPHRILANVSGALWAGNTPPTRHRVDASLPIIRATPTCAVRTHRGTSPEAVLPLSFDVANVNLTPSVNERCVAQGLLGALHSAWRSVASELELHWYSRAEGIYLASQSALKSQQLANRLRESKKQASELAARQLEAAERAWAERVADAARASEGRALELETRHASYVEYARCQIGAWEDRYNALERSRDALNAAVMEAQRGLKDMHQEVLAARGDVASREAAMTALSVQLAEHNKRRQSAITIGTQCAEVSAVHQSTETSCAAWVARSTQTEEEAGPPKQQYAPVLLGPSQYVASRSPSAVSPNLHGGGFSDALIRENREKHLALLETRLLELDHRHHYCVGDSASSNGSESNLGSLGRPEGRSLPPRAIRSATGLFDDGGARSSPTTLEGLHEALMLQHSGVSRRRSAPGTPVVPVDARHPYAVPGDTPPLKRQS